VLSGSVTAFYFMWRRDKNRKKALELNPNLPKNIADDKFLTESIVRNGKTLEELDDLMTRIQESWRAHHGRILWRNVAKKVRAMSARVLATMHTQEAQRLAFSTDMYSTWRDRTIELETQQTYLLNKVNSDLRSNFKLRKYYHKERCNARKNELQILIQDEKAKVVNRLTVASRIDRIERVNDEEIKSSWFNGVTKSDEYEDWRRVKDFQEFKLGLAATYKIFEAHSKIQRANSKKELIGRSEGKKRWIEAKYDRSITIAREKYDKWRTEVTGDRGLIMEISKNIIKAAAQKMVYIPIGADDVLKIKARWAQLPNTSKALTPAIKARVRVETSSDDDDGIDDIDAVDLWK